MSIFEIRQIIESSIPWYAPVCFVVVLYISLFLLEKLK